jgi:hypothetical protein
MTRLSLKTLFFTALALTVIFSPIALDFFPSGTSYAELDSLPVIIPDSRLDSLPFNKGDPEPSREPTSVPEPAALLLLGSGVIGLVALRKKLKK